MNIKSAIEQIIQSNNVVLFMKGTAIAPACGFSAIAVNALNHLKVDFKDINVLESDEIRAGIKEYSDWPTIPQLYIKQQFIGGADIISEMFKNGELKELLLLDSS